MFGWALGGAPSALVALAWASTSTSSARAPRSASAAARLTAVVVLPTPPFWLVIATMVTVGLFRRRGAAAAMVGV